MKKATLIFIILSLSTLTFSATKTQSNNSDLWKKIETCLSNRTPESAMVPIAQLKAILVRDQITDQSAKLLIYQMKFAQMNEEKSLPDFIKNIEKELHTSWFPYNNLLHSMLAESYLNYFKQNRYSFYNRKTQAGSDAQDIENLTELQIFEKINTHIQSSVKQSEKLIQVPLNQWDTILEKGTKPSNYRNNLYDFLAWRGVDLYKQCISLNSKPSSNFNSNVKAYFGNTQEFADLKIATTDSLNSNYLALKLIQELTRRNINSKEVEKMYDTDLQRLQLAKEIWQYEDSAYKVSLINLDTATKGLQLNSLAKYQLAQIYNQSGTTESIKKALELCKMGYMNFQKSEGGINCKALENEIIAQSFSIQLEQTYPSSYKIEGQLTYKNISKIYARIYKLTNASQKEYYYVDSIIKKAKLVREFEITTNTSQDYLSHTKEFDTDSISTGNYALIGSAKKEFGNKENILNVAKFTVTNLTIVTDIENASHQILVLNRVSGKPIANATYQLKIYGENYYRGKEELFNGKSNEKGEIYVGNSLLNAKSIKSSIKLGNDELIDETPYCYYRHQTRETSQQEDFIFTDRKIYRPSQPIYFKIVSFITNSKVASAKEGDLQTINLQDSNGKIISTQTVTTNKYGSASGIFSIPSNVLNGDWTISSNLGRAYFRVEEYVRPKFEMTFLPISGMYLAGDTALIEGQATSYTLMQLQNCTVKYKISMTEGVMPLYRNGCYIPYNREEYTIALNSIKTDAQGKFAIRFPIPKTSSSNQSYDISADVTSSTGETISANTNLQVKSSLASINTDFNPTFEFNSPANILTISKKNSNGVLVDLPVSYEIYSLNSDFPLQPEKLWQNEEPILASGNNHLKCLPTQEYQANLSKLPIKELIYKGNLKANENTITTNVFKSLKTGLYRIVLKGDATRGETIANTSEFTIIDSKSSNLERPAFLHFALKENNIKGGDTLRFTIGSTLKGCDIYYQIIWNNNTSIDKKWTANNSKTLVEMLIPVKYNGNVKIEAFTINGNRIYHQTQSINIESKETMLNLKLITFRDKIAPNAKENWQIEVKDFENKSPDSELLIAMYDASLDAFAANQFGGFYNLFSTPYIYRTLLFYNSNLSYGNGSNTINALSNYNHLSYPSLNWYNFFQNRNFDTRQRSMMAGAYAGQPMEEMSIQAMAVPAKMVSDGGASDDIMQANETTNLKKEKKEVGKAEEIIQPSIRKNLQETAFFLPHITTTTGIASFSFTAPEALTTWKLMAIAHTIDGKSGTVEFKTTTQKELMVAPNMPRFLYQNDRIQFKTSISRLSNKLSNGKVTLTLTDENGNIVNNLIEGSTSQDFTFASNNTISVAWWINIKDAKNGIYVKTVAESANFSDGEQRFLPIIPSKTRVVESIPFYTINKGEKKLTFNKLRDNVSKVDNRKLTICYTQNASWEVIKALPYLLEGKDENSDEIFNRYYANALTSNILQHNSDITKTIENWSHETNGNRNALTSNLELNDEAKSVQLDQTPWLNDGKNETDARKRLVTLLNQNKINTEQSNTLSKLLANQMANGAWPWFKGMEASTYITQYIAKGLIEMSKDSIDSQLNEEQYWSMVEHAVNYCDNQIIEDYRKAIKQKITPSPSLTDIEYLAMRELAKSIKTPKELVDIKTKYQDSIKSHWTDYSSENQALIAQWFHRSGSTKLASNIMESLFQCAIKSVEMGNYYKREANYGYFRNDIEKHSNILKAFAEIGGYNSHVRLMQLYLIQQKRTNRWESNKATALAIGALMLGEEKWMANPTKSDRIFVNKTEIVPDATENGTGYFAKSWFGGEITPSLADIKIEKNSTSPSWGSMSWEYFTDVESVEQNSQNPLSINREYLKINETLRGIEYEAISEKTSLRIGDKILVRLTVKTDRPMEYIHLKDNRAASSEPLELFSGYNYNGGIGYYQNMKDASSNFYIHYMPKGVWKVEYTTRVSQVGQFRSGICTVQCYYAPEFQNQTKGSKLDVKE